MNSEAMLDELVALLEQAGADMRPDHLGGGGGGLCNIRGRATVFVDLDTSIRERAAVCARALAEVVDIETIYMRPGLRLFVEREMERAE